MSSFTWTNPILDAGAADPCIFRAEGRYWLIATGRADDGRHLPLWSSENLVDWRSHGGAVARGAEGAWNRYNFWAPEVLQHAGRYWLYYTAKPARDADNAGNRVGLAVADQPDGPYTDVGVVIDHASLDGSPFCDADGQLWLYFVTDHGNLNGHPAGKIWVDRLLEPQRAAGEPQCILDRHPWQEGPVVFRQDDGRYRLSYSLGAWTDDSYRVAQAVGDHPAGPFVESEALIMRSSETVKGPGHHNLFIGPDGERWLIYHGWDAAMTTRYPRIDRLRVAADGSLSSDAPSNTQQEYCW